jgi:branched-chain amino acid transport system permease protein
MTNTKQDVIFRIELTDTKRSQWKWIIGMGIALIFSMLWPLLFADVFILHVSILVYIYMIGAVSLNLIMRTGLLSFAHAGFMGLGAYTSTILVMKAGVPFIVAFLMAGIVPGALALIIGPILFRLKGVYFVLTTFVLGEVIRLVFVGWQSLTGGSNGIYNIPPMTLGLSSFSFPLVSKLSVYYFSLFIVILVCSICFSLNKSEFGRCLNIINEGDVLGECLGVNTLKYKLLAFSLGAFMVGFAGSIFAHYVRYISPIDFTWRVVLDFIASNVVGGIFFNVGPIIGTLILTPLPEFLRKAVEYQWILYSIIILLMILFVPGGLVSLPQRIRREK